MVFEYIYVNEYVYRDLKFENVFIDVDGYIKFIDFGFCCWLLWGECVYMICGIVDYMVLEVMFV